MITKNEFKQYISLKQKNARVETGLFIAEGRNVVKEGILHNAVSEIIFITKDFLDVNSEFRQILKGRKTEILDDRDFERIADTDNPQGIVGIFQNKSLLTERITINRTIALYEINDPRNMGTIIRTADWFGIDEILISQGSVDVFNPKVIRSTMGSIFHVRIIITEDIKGALFELRSTGYKIAVADMGGTSYRSVRGLEKVAAVFSNEARGPSDSITALADIVATIPGNGSAESLNVACAASVIMSEMVS